MILASILALAVAQEPQATELTIDDLFTLAPKTLRVQERPVSWVDDDHYLVFDAGPGTAGNKGDKTESLWKVHAETGARSMFLDFDKLAGSLGALPGFTEGWAADSLTASDLRLSDDYRAALINTANDLFYVDVATAAVRRLTHTPDEEVGEQISPDGKLVAYVRDYNLYVVPVDGGPERALTDGGHKDLLYGRLDWVYQEELYGRGNFQGFWWSPSSTQIALLRLDESPVEEFTLVSDTPVRPLVEIENYPKAGDPNPEVQLGVVDVRGGPVRYADLSRYGTQDILVVRVAWHPGGGHVYLQVQDREQTWLELLSFAPGAVPFAGEVDLVLREESESWVEADGNPLWVADGEDFLWLSERDGYKHLYRYGKNGEAKGRVTIGPWEVTSVESVDEEAGVVYFTSTRTDVKERHLWRVGIDGSDAAAITTAPGTHGVDLSPGHDYFVDSFSSVEAVQHVDVVRTDGESVRRLVDSDMSVVTPYRFVPPEFVQVETRDGFVMEAMLIKPRGYVEGQRYPTMCYIYSGPHAAQVRNRWDRRTLWHQYLAARGYLVWVCDNRSASGKGRVSASACYRDMGSGEKRDLEDGVDWLVAQGYTDPKRVGIWGWSYGGYQTSFCLTHSTKWSLGIAVNPVTDWRFYDSIYTERYMGLPQTNADGYARSSVVRAASDLHGKLLLVHATMDDNVHMQNSMQLVHALQAAGKQFDFMVYPRVRHGIANGGQQRHLFRMMADYIAEHL